MNNVLLLDSNFQPIDFINYKKAMRLIVKNKVEIVKQSSIKLRDGFFLPLIIRLITSISSFYKRQIPWNKQNVFIRDSYVCQYCGKKLLKSKCTIDHIIPTSKGGKNTWENTVTSCKPCNNKKGYKELHEINFKLLKTPKKPTLFDFIMLKFKDVDLKNIW